MNEIDEMYENMNVEDVGIEQTGCLWIVVV